MPRWEVAELKYDGRSDDWYLRFSEFQYDDQWKHLAGAWVGDRKKHPVKDTGYTYFEWPALDRNTRPSAMEIIGLLGRLGWEPVQYHEVQYGVRGGLATDYHYLFKRPLAEPEPG